MYSSLGPPGCWAGADSDADNDHIFIVLTSARKERVGLTVMRTANCRLGARCKLTSYLSFNSH